MSILSFELSREHQEFRRTVRDFAETEIAPHAAQWDRDHHFPVDVVQKMGKLGLFGLTSPEEYGGAGEDGDFTSPVSYTHLTLPTNAVCRSRWSPYH